MKQKKTFSKLEKIILIATLAFGFSDISIFAEAASDSINFTKKEIAFFKWGTSENEVKLSTDGIAQRAAKNPKPEKPNLDEYRWANTFRMDGNDNLYFNGGNGFIFVVSPDGSSIKTISIKKTGGFLGVDDKGNIYSFYLKAGEPRGFILTRPDGTQQIYKDFKLGPIENGVVYDSKGTKAVTIFDNDGNPEKRPPLLFSFPNATQKKSDFETDFRTGTFTFDTKKINAHLKKINKKIATDKVQIKLGFNNDQNFIGVDDDENFYFVTCLHESTAIYTPCKEAYVSINSSQGLKLAEVPIEKNYFNGQGGAIEIDTHGSFFEMVAVVFTKYLPVPLSPAREVFRLGLV